MGSGLRSGLGLRCRWSPCAARADPPRAAVATRLVRGRGRGRVGGGLGIRAWVGGGLGIRAWVGGWVAVSNYCSVE